MSTSGPPSGRIGRRASLRIVFAKPRTSSAVTPFARNPASSAPPSAGDESRIGECDEQVRRLRLAQVTAIEQLFENFAQSTHYWRLAERCRRKLSISSGPCGVSTLSG